MQSLTLRWTPPLELGEGSDITKFYIEYSAMDENATEAVAGSNKLLEVSNTDEVEITNLQPGTLYAFSSQVHISYFLSFISQKSTQQH